MSESLDAGEGKGIPAPQGALPNPTLLHETFVPAESWQYKFKKRALGKPIPSDSLSHESLSKPIALGVLSSDCISSSAYGSEQILAVLVPVFGIAAFGLLMPITLVVLLVLVVVTLCYRDVVMAYTKAGGSYVVARDNFGPKTAQVAAVALMLDYVVTVALQAAAGTAALISGIQVGFNSDVLVPFSTPITLAVIAVLFYGNLRGIREAGRVFAVPTYLFVTSLGLVILLGIFKAFTGTLPVQDASSLGAGDGTTLLSVVGVFVLLKAFANGGSSLTGLEAISNGVGAFREPRGKNARSTLVIMSVILGSLVAGVSFLAYRTHAIPFASGTPTVVAQISSLVLGDSPLGRLGFLLVSTATMLILWTGANTPFNGFPFLASFVAGDSYLPRQLNQRGHRLGFSNGIIVLTLAAVSLVVVAGANVTALVAFYAIGVFTGFSFAGFGMTRHHRRVKEGSWRFKAVVSWVAGFTSALVVVIFAVTKFTDGAWLVILLFPILSFALIRLNKEYGKESVVLKGVLADTLKHSETPLFSRHLVLVMVDNLDVASLRALRYARSLRPDEVRAVHVVLDPQHAASLGDEWDNHPELRVPITFVDCSDRRLRRAVVELVSVETASGRTEVTVLLPRRSYSPLLGRLLHDRTADKIAADANRLPHVAATVIPFDVTSRRGDSSHVPASVLTTRAGLDPIRPLRTEGHAEAVPIGDLVWRDWVTIEGRVHTTTRTRLASGPAYVIELWDESGGVKVSFIGRSNVPGVDVGARVRVTGRVGSLGSNLAISNPRYELLPRD